MEGINTPPPEEVPPTLHDNDMLPPLSRPRKDLPVGGRLAHFQNRWGEITEDSWVLSVVRKGYKIPFVNKPFLSPTSIFHQQTESLALVKEVNKLLHKGSVEKIEPEGPGFYSRIFLVPKKNGKLRLIIDLSRLNTFLDIQSFRIETANKVRQTIQPNDWAFSLDLTDAYLPVPIHWQSRKFLRFCLKGRAYQFKALPFGLGTSPYVFTRLMVAIATYLWKRAIVLFPFLDDWLVRNQVRQEILRDRQFTIELIMSLGLIINEEKSDLVPSQNFVFIGMEFLTHKNIVRVPLDRVQGILDLLLWFKKQKQVSARVFLSLLGKLSAAAQFVVLGNLHLRLPQMALFAQWKPHVLPLEYPILLNAPIRKHLECWDNKGRFISDVTLKPSLPTHSLFTDTGLSRWGAHLEPEGLLFHGVWTPDQSVLHINVLEMKAILLALKQCHQNVSNSTVMVATDNSSVVFVSEERRGHPFSISVHGGMGDTPVVQSERNKSSGETYTRKIKHFSRPVKSSFQTNFDRMVSGSDDLQLDSVDDGLSKHRFVCDSSQQEVTTLCVSYPRRKGSGDRCNVNELERNARLCVSSVCSDSSYNQQDSPTSLQHSVDSSSLGRNVLVSGHSSVSCSTGHLDSLAQKSVDTIGSEICQGKRRKLKTSRLEFIRRSIRDRKFSANVARHAAEARRSSTR